MKISIIHPSRGRPEQAIETAHKWLLCAETTPEYILVLDNDDFRSYIEGYQKLYQMKLGFWVPKPEENKNAIQAINHGASISGGDLLIVVSDDFDCPNHWDTLLIEALKDKSDFCVKTQDGFQKVLMTLPIMDRTYYNRFGYIYNPIYKHWYADQEMTAVAHMIGRVVDVDIEFTHNHYLAGKGTKDAINERNDLSRYSGKEIYQQRVKENFGIDFPANAYLSIKWR